MEGLGQDLRLFRGIVVGVQRHGGEAGDEHDLDIRVELRRSPRQFDPVHLRHHDIGEKQFERLLAKPVVGRKPVVERRHVVARVLQRLAEEAAHVVVVFREQDLTARHAVSIGHVPFQKSR